MSSLRSKWTREERKIARAIADLKEKQKKLPDPQRVQLINTLHNMLSKPYGVNA